MIISLKDITGKETDRIEFLNCLLLNFEKVYSEFLQGRFPDILERWKFKSSIINQKIKVTDHDNIFTGIVKEITPEGYLIVSTDNGICQVNSGDINYLKDVDR